MSDPIIWVLLGERTGDNNQAMALAEALGMPFVTKQLDYNLLRAVTRWLGPTKATLKPEFVAQLSAPWPDVVIGIGRRSVPVARWIRKQSAGRAKLVLIGNPRIDPGLFDLVVTTRQYPVPPGANVLLLPVAMSRFVAPPAPTAKEQAFLAEAGQFRLIAIGGATKYWTMPVERIVEAVRRPFEGNVVAVTSRRTDPAIIEELRDIPALQLVDGSSPRFALLLDRAVEIFVTGDSVSLLSEAVLAGKPVALIPIEQDAKGRRELGPAVQESGPNARRRDLRRFWNYLIEQEMVGSIEEGPRQAAVIPEPNRMAAEAVRRLLT